MIDLTNTFIVPRGFYNSTIPKGIIKIPIINLTPSKKVNVPVRFIFNIRFKYMLLNLIFNQLTNVI